MNIEASLRAIAQRVQALLECTSVTLSLDPPLTYSHPLLNLLIVDEEFERSKEQHNLNACHMGKTDGRPQGLRPAIHRLCLRSTQGIVGKPLVGFRSNTCLPYPSYCIDTVPAMPPSIQTLIANAIQERTIQCDNDCELSCDGMTMRSVAIVSLERPAGLLGVLICLHEERNVFLRGECMLLEQAVPTIAREIELLLCDAVLDCVQEKSKLVSEKDSVEAGVELSEQQTLVSLVGHDLRLPLTAIKGYAGLLQAYGTASTAVASTQVDIAPELQRHYLNVIMEQTQHMEVLVNDLLDVSRIQHGQVALRYTWVDIVSLCRDVVQMMQDKISRQNDGRCYIHFSPDAQMTLLWADPDRIQQVLTNLIENAVKYSPDGGLIEVMVRSYRSSSTITVRDWGMGIPRSQQTTLFRLFERGSQEKQRAGTGLGLGLYIARTLVEAMNGSISVSSSEGQGTSVSFTLPKSSFAETTKTTKTQEISNEMHNSCEKLSSLLY